MGIPEGPTQLGEQKIPYRRHARRLTQRAVTQEPQVISRPRRRTGRQRAAERYRDELACTHVRLGDEQYAQTRRRRRQLRSEVAGAQDDIRFGHMSV